MSSKENEADEIEALIHAVQVAPSEDDAKTTAFAYLSEYLLHRISNVELLKQFYSQVLELGLSHREVKKSICKFISDSCMDHPELIEESLPTLSFLLQDENVNVLKASVTCMNVLFPLLCRRIWMNNREDDAGLWKSAMSLKEIVLSFMDTTTNDGLHILVLRFIYTMCMAYSEAPESNGSQTNLLLLPPDHIIVNKEAIKAEGISLLERLLDYVRRPDLSAGSVMAIINFMGPFVKQRPIFIPIVVQVLLDLHLSPPSQLSLTQTTSVLHTLKLVLGSIRGQVAPIYIPLINEALGDLKKRKREIEPIDTTSKKVVHTFQTEESEDINTSSGLYNIPLSTVIDILFSILQSTPIDKLAELCRDWKEEVAQKSEEIGVALTKDPRLRLQEEERERQLQASKFVLAPVLLESSQEAENISQDCLSRIIEFEEAAKGYGIRLGWVELLARLFVLLADQIVPTIADATDIEVEECAFLQRLIDLILNDFKNKYDLAISFLYKAWYIQVVDIQAPSLLYNNALNSIVSKIQKRVNDGSLTLDKSFMKFMVQLPKFIPAICVPLLQNLCSNGTASHPFAFAALKELAAVKLPARSICTTLLLEFSRNNDSSIRHEAIAACLTLYTDVDVLKKTLEAFAVSGLSELIEDYFDVSVDLFFQLASENPVILLHLLQIYETYEDNIKKKILDILPSIVNDENAERFYGLFNENIDEPSLPLLSVILNQLSAISKITPEFSSIIVSKIKARELPAFFFVPLIASMSKKVLLDCIPELIELAGEKDKSMFLAVIQAGCTPTGASPLTPIEFFVALHNVPDTFLRKASEATSVCIGQPSIFKAELLAASLQILSDQPTLPTLLMHTVMQACKTYRSLSTFSSGLLVRLISRKVWKYPTLWEGFLRSCKLLAPSSFQAVLQLPTAQVSELLQKFEDLKPQLLEYINAQPPSLRHRYKDILRLL